MTDIQRLIDAVNATGSEERGHYHLTYGGLIDTLKAADPDAEIDDRVRGIDSYRGYYIDIALSYGQRGVSVVDAEYRGNYDDYLEWSEKHPRQEIDNLPRNAHALAEVMESLLGKYLTGYKGGEYEVTRDKPLWLALDDGDCSDVAVIGIDDDLLLITRDVES